VGTIRESLFFCSSLSSFLYDELLEHYDLSLAAASLLIPQDFLLLFTKLCIFQFSLPGLIHQVFYLPPIAYSLGQMFPRSQMQRRPLSCLLSLAASRTPQQKMTSSFRFLATANVRRDLQKLFCSALRMLYCVTSYNTKTHTPSSLPSKVRLPLLTVLPLLRANSKRLTPPPKIILNQKKRSKQKKNPLTNLQKSILASQIKFPHLTSPHPRKTLNLKKQNFHQEKKKKTTTTTTKKLSSTTQ
jgi:hypothetical protein